MAPFVRPNKAKTKQIFISSKKQKLLGKMNQKIVLGGKKYIKFNQKTH
jgi:hypothetical protein